MEIIVVMLIMGILAAAATPTFFRSLQYSQLESASRRLKSDLDQLRVMARTKSKSEVWTFTSPATYTLPPDVALLDRSTGTYAVDLSKSPYKLDSVALNLGGQTTITFDGYGSPSQGGNIVLKAGTYKRTVTLDGTSGIVTVTNP